MRSAPPPTPTAICHGVGNFCRKTNGGSTGPHCEIEFKKRCRRPTPATMRTTSGDRCIKTAHGAPLPLSSGGVSVCVVNEFTEDVTGTTNLATGAGSIPPASELEHLHRAATLQQPCPVCGGFCSGPGGASGPGARNLCDDNADCAPARLCVTDADLQLGSEHRPAVPSESSGGGRPSSSAIRAWIAPIGAGQRLLGTINILFNPADDRRRPR